MTLKVCIALPIHLRQLNASWVIIGGVCTDVFGQNHRHFHTKYYFNRLKFFYSCMCVCDQFPEQYPSANLENCPNLPKSRVGTLPPVFGTVHPAIHLSQKSIQKKPVYYPENSDKLIFIDKKRLKQ